MKRRSTVLRLLSVLTFALRSFTPGALAFCGLPAVSELPARSFTRCALVLFALFVAPTFSQDNNQAALDKLRAEIRSLEQTKREKADALEKAEAARWDGRYKQQAEIKEWENQTRKWEARYAKLTTLMSQTQEDLIRTGNEAQAAEEEKQEVDARRDAFRLRLQQAAEKEMENLSGDFPLGLNDRLEQLNAVVHTLGEGLSGLEKSLQVYFQYREKRLAFSASQSFEKVETLVNGSPQAAWQLRIGSLTAVEKTISEPPAVQMLLRTGQLQGKVFSWRSDLEAEHRRQLMNALEKIQGGAGEVVLTLDVLQTKSWGSGYTGEEKQSLGQRAGIWFKTGGLVMYPLAFAALLGLLLSLERGVLFFRRSLGTRFFARKVLPKLQSKNWEEAIKLCRSSSTSLSRVIESILKEAAYARSAGEKAAREALLREFPSLEKRMVFLAAIGGAAPLMGLLGTVSGMISLFQVITDVGTNDPRILAGGISEALITTQTGLVIAIPILLIHGYLSDRMDRIRSEITSKSYEAINRVWPEGSAEA